MLNWNFSTRDSHKAISTIAIALRFLEEATFSLTYISEVERNEKSRCHTWTSEGLVPGRETLCVSNRIS